MVQFNPALFDSFIEKSNEKEVLVKGIKNLIGEKKESCLEIGPGDFAFFYNSLSSLFSRYVVVEKESFSSFFPDNVFFIKSDWEDVELSEKFDVIIASHVFYYFNDKRGSLKKIISHLKEGGKAFIVVNGTGSDYGSFKKMFSNVSGKEYASTYEEVKKVLQGLGVDFSEHSLHSELYFSSYEELFNLLKLFFESCPFEYEKAKKEILAFFKENLTNGKFEFEQKIFEIKKS